MPPALSRTYRVGEFARLAGVTPRALHHYDRLGLLKPQRTAAGYRPYTDHDLERLVQVVALKFIGIPLRRIGRLAATKTTDLAVALQAQRQALEEKRRLLDQAIGAIHEAEAALRREGQAAPALYRRIIEVIDMQSNNDWNAKYQELVNAKIARLKTLTPEQLTALRQEWSSLIEDVRGMLTDDPAGPRAQELAAYQAGRAWAPSEADQPVWDFMQRALAQR